MKMAVFPEIPVESLREPPSQFIQCVLHCSPILDFFQKKEQRFFYDNAAVAQLIFSPNPGPAQTGHQATPLKIHTVSFLDFV